MTYCLRAAHFQDAKDRPADAGAGTNRPGEVLLHLRLRLEVESGAGLFLSLFPYALTCLRAGSEQPLFALSERRNFWRQAGTGRYSLQHAATEPASAPETTIAYWQARGDPCRHWWEKLACLAMQFPQVAQAATGPYRTVSIWLT